MDNRFSFYFLNQPISKANRNGRHANNTKEDLSNRSADDRQANDDQQIENPKDIIRIFALFHVYALIIVNQK